MARARHVVVIALIMFAIIGLARAADPPKASADDYEEDDSEYLIGTTAKGGAMSPGSVVAAPIGGPVPPGAFDDTLSPMDPGSAASPSFNRFSAVAGAATAALGAFFYF